MVQQTVARLSLLLGVQHRRERPVVTEGYLYPRQAAPWPALAVEGLAQRQQLLNRSARPWVGGELLNYGAAAVQICSD